MKSVKMRSYWIRGGPESNITDVLTRKDHTGKTEGADSATIRELPGAAGSGRRQGRESLRDSTPLLTPGVWASRLRSVKE